MFYQTTETVAAPTPSSSTGNDNNNNHNNNGGGGGNEEQQQQQQQQQHEDATRAAVHEFVYRYYDTLSSCPHDAWRSYTVGAQYTHVDAVLDEAGCCGMKPAVGQHEIHASIVYQRFAECRFRVRSVHVQNGAADGLHAVLVTGDLARGQCAPVMFVQSLVVENIERINQFAIRNAILNVYNTTRP